MQSLPGRDRDPNRESPTSETARDRRRRHAWTLAATSLGFAVVQLDVSVVNVAVKPIGADLGGGIADLQWVISAYTIAFAAFILSAGALGDRIGARRVFIAGFAVFTTASAACGLAGSLAELIAARAAQGIGAAVLVPCSLTLLNHAFREPRQRARALGLWALGASAALSAGPLVGGVLIATLGWRAIFFINAPIGLIGIAATVRWASETTRSPGRGVDLPGQIAAIVCLLSTAGATIEGGSHGFDSPGVIAGWVLAALAGAAFVLIEARTRRPMLPLRLFRVPTFASATAIGLLINVAFYGLIFLLSLFFQRTQHLSALSTGLAFAPMTVAVMAANAIAGRLAARIGADRVIALGGLMLAACTGALTTTAAGTSYLVLVGPLLGLGFGLGLIVPTMTSALLGSVERSRSGVAAGTLNTARQTGSAVGVALFGALAAGRQLLPGLHIALLILTGLGVLVATLCIWVRPQAQQAPPGGNFKQAG